MHYALGTLWTHLGSKEPGVTIIYMTEIMIVVASLIRRTTMVAVRPGEWIANANLLTTTTCTTCFCSRGARVPEASALCTIK